MDLTRRRSVMIAGLIGAVSVVCLVVGIGQGSAATSTRAIPAASNDYTGPFVTMKVPTFCASTPANTRYYTDPLPQADLYMRSGQHNHGALHCIFFGTGTDYGKWLVIDQGKGGYVIGPQGLDVTYTDCSPANGERFPNPPNASTPNDCAESWATGEGNWVFVTGPNTGQKMIPGSTP